MMILIGSPEFGMELSGPTMTLPSGFPKGPFSKKELPFPGGTRLEPSQGITEVVGAFLSGSLSRFPPPNYKSRRAPSPARLRESPPSAIWAGPPRAAGGGVQAGCVEASDLGAI